MPEITYQTLTLQNGLYLTDEVLRDLWATYVVKTQSWAERVRYAQTILELRAIELEMEHAEQVANIINTLQSFRRIEAFCSVDKHYFDRKRSTPMPDEEYLNWLLGHHKAIHH